MPETTNDDDPVRAGGLARALGITPGEGRQAAWSTLYHFLLLCSWYLIRPVREEIGSQHEAKLQWIWTGTFIAMLLAVPIYTRVVALLPRQRFIPLTYGFFALTLIAFHFVIGPSSPWQVRGEIAFYVWASVFNLFVISVFWQFMVDIHRKAQSKRLFGIIAVGGTLGTIVASAVAALLTSPPEWMHVAGLAPRRLLLLGTGLLGLAACCAVRLHTVARETRVAGGAAADDDAGAQPVRGSVLEGLLAIARSPYLLGICVYLVLHGLAGTFVYYRLAELTREALPDRGDRASLYASINLWVNLIVITMQLLATGRLLKYAGVGLTLIILPLVNVAGFTAVALFPGLAAVATFEVARRASNYAMTKPAREVLFTTVPRRDKYKAKAFMDTVVYRGGDAVSGFVVRGIQKLAVDPTLFAALFIPIAVAWACVGLGLGRAQERQGDGDRGDRVPASRVER